LGHRVAAFDLGARRIGVAVSDAAGAFVVWRGVLQRSSPLSDRQAVTAILEEYPNSTIVVGLPLLMDETEGAQALRSRQWAESLFAARPETLVFRDERLTTDAARQRGDDRTGVDAQAAEVLLLDYLREPDSP
jgi:putative Holliday junction resolvase